MDEMGFGSMDARIHRSIIEVLITVRPINAKVGKRGIKGEVRGINIWSFATRIHCTRKDFA